KATAVATDPANPAANTNISDRKSNRRASAAATPTYTSNRTSSRNVVPRSADQPQLAIVHRSAKAISNVRASQRNRTPRGSVAMQNPPTPNKTANPMTRPIAATPSP